MEPTELTDPEALGQKLAQGGVITITRGMNADAIAHTTDCRSLEQVRVPRRQTRYWWTPDYPTAATTLGARKCQHCQGHRRYRSPFLPRP